MYFFASATYIPENTVCVYIYINYITLYFVFILFFYRCDYCGWSLVKRKDNEKFLQNLKSPFVII